MPSLTRGLRAWSSCSTPTIRRPLRERSWHSHPTSRQPASPSAACALTVVISSLAPCMRQRPFGIAGEWHSLPLRVFAPHRALRFMGNLLCLGLILHFFSTPPVGPHDAHDGLTAFMDMDVFHCDLLLPLAPMAV